MLAGLPESFFERPGPGVVIDHREFLSSGTVGQVGTDANQRADRSSLSFTAIAAETSVRLQQRSALVTEPTVSA
jgi:hypothetical protein